MAAFRKGATVKVEGLRDLDKALGQFSKSVARNVLRRALVKAGEPIAERARELVPVDDGDLKKSIKVSPKIKNTVGNAEFAAAMRAGLGKDAAVSAMRDARRAANGAGSFAEMYVGPGRLPQAHMVEFGSIHNTPHPYLRPAWDAKKGEALGLIKGALADEINKAAARAAKRAARASARAAAKG